MKLYLRILILCVLSLNYSDLSAQNYNIEYRSRIPFSASAGVWGYVDTLGNEYALLGTENKIVIIDVTNPDSIYIKFEIPGPNSIWREIRTYGKYAYVTTEGGGGVTILNLSKLPDSINHKQYRGDGVISNQINDVHALHIDQQKLYLYGSDLFAGKAYSFSLNDPWNPTFIAPLSTSYTHDGFVKNDTLYACQIYSGFVEIIDSRNPLSPIVINTINTPKAFPHNSWLSSNSKVLYTTDELNGSCVTAYDISNILNINELDRYKSDTSSSIPHNVLVLNDSTVTGTKSDYLWTAYYTEGVTLVDAKRPDNLVEIGRFDTSPNFVGGGTNGAWGVYPYLPSGNVLVSDMQMGLYVLTPEYKNPYYLEFTVLDSISNLPIPSANIRVLSNYRMDGITNLNGVYKTGTVDSGLVTIEVNSNLYNPKRFNVVLGSNFDYKLTIQLSKQKIFNLNVNVSDSINKSIANAFVFIKNQEYSYQLLTDTNGYIQIPNFHEGEYKIHILKFGYLPLEIENILINDSLDLTSIMLTQGYYDDFRVDFGWTTYSTASTGLWVRDKPIPTFAAGVYVNPNEDVINDIGDMCFITGNAFGSVSFDDVDNGVVELTSPSFDLINYNNPYVHFNTWFTNLASSGQPNDTLLIMINNGTQLEVLDRITSNSTNKGKWIARSYELKKYLPITNNMKIIVSVSDLAGSDHITEAGFDKFYITDSTLTGVSNNQNSIYANVYPNPTNGKIEVSYSFKNDKNGSIKVYDILGNKVFEKQLTESYGMMNINLENNGLYFVRIESANEQKVIKVVKR